MSKHTKEPWINDAPSCVAIHHPEGGKETVALFPNTVDGQDRAIRAVACHNALLGLNPEAVGECVEALTPLARIADAYDANELDDEARKFWGVMDEHQNKTKPEDIEIYSGRGGRQLITLADCIAARAALAKLRTPTAEVK